jgi:hypothetical protein
MGLLYPEPVKVEGRTRSLGDAWVRHPQRRFYRGLELAPNGGNPDYYNMWKGFAVTPAKGEWPLFREHLHLVANKNEDHARYILAWMAKTVQEPHKPIGITLALKGKQGTGKSTFAKWFGALFGEHFLHLDSEQHLLGRFNSHLHNTIVLLADEAVWAGSKAGLGALKRMITEDTLNIERKGVDILPVKNMLHMIVASNEKWVVPTSFDNRRFAIFGTHDGHINDARFFASVEDELFNRGGLAALLYDLLEMSTDAVNLRQIPQTRDLQEQKVLSADPDEQWWVERLHQGYLEVTDRRNSDGEVVGKDYKWPERIEKDTLHASYLEFLNTLHRGGRSPKATETELGQFLQRRTLLHDRRSLIGGERVRVWIVPSLETCRRHWAEHNGMDDDYPWDD